MPETMEHQQNEETKTIRWGMIGVGRIGKSAIAPAIKKSGTGSLLAISSRSAEKAGDLAEELSVDRCYVGYEELLADDDIDAVYIGLPNGLHGEWIKKAASAGKHILCEKSLTFSSEEAKELVAFCEAKGVLLMEAFMYRHHPQWKVIRKWIADQEIGKINLIEGLFVANIDTEKDHRLTDDLGRGCLYDLTCYPINVSRYLTGEEPKSISAHGHFVSRYVDLSSHVTLQFPSGIIASAMGSFETRFHQGVMVFGEKGTIGIEKPFVPGMESVRVTLENDAGRKTHDVPGADHFTQQIRLMNKSILGGEGLLFPAENGVCNVTVCEMAMTTAYGNYQG